MGTRNITFGDHDDEGKAGDLLTFDIDSDDFQITESITSGASILTNDDDGTTYEANVTGLFTAENMVQIQVPQDITTGQYSYSLVLFDTQDMSNKVVCNTTDIIELEGSGAELEDPDITDVYFAPNLRVIDAIDMTQLTLTINGNYLGSIDSVSLTNLGVLFNIITQAPFVMSARAVSIPSIVGTRVCQVEVHYTITDEEGEFVREGTVTSVQTITING